MKKQISKIAIALFCVSPLLAQAQPNDMMQAKVIQFLVETDASGNSKPMIIDSNGKKIELTLGTLLNAAAETWMQGSQAMPPKMDPKAIAMIRFDKTGNGIKTALVDNKGKTQPLDLGSFLSVAAVNYPGCNAEQISGQMVNLPLSFEINSSGNLQTYLVGPNGNEPFNFGIMLREITVRLNQCQAQQ